MRIFKNYFLLLTSLVLFLFPPSRLLAQEGLLLDTPREVPFVEKGFQEAGPVDEEILEGRVVGVVEEQEIDEEFGGGFYQRLEVLVTCLSCLEFWPEVIRWGRQLWVHC